MPQLSLYLSDQEMESLREHAGREGVSLSRYARRVLGARQSAWPEGYWNLYGACKDDSFIVPDELDEEWDRSVPSFDGEDACTS